MLETQPPIVVALFSLGMYGIAYFGITAQLGVTEARQMLTNLSWRRKGR